MLSAPLLGWRHVKVTDRRAKPDLAHVWKDRADVHFPEKKIVVVMDHLNTHKRSTLYNAFEPAEVFRLAQRFEVHHTPKHESGLNMAAIAINVMTRQCLAQ